MRKKDVESVFRNIVTGDDGMKDIFRYCAAVSASPWPVLITGETGAGKELFARAVHELSGTDGRMVSINISGLDNTLLSDTLFGHVKGAFTGASMSRSGALAQAAGGTLFIDEIGDLAPSSQIKLLRLLQEREYSPLGSDQVIRSNVRIISATHRNLPELVEQGSFREDLYYRISTHRIAVPPQRERAGDIILLLDHLLAKACSRLNCPVPSYPPELPEILSRYSFPGNVRELEGMTFDAVSRTAGSQLDLSAFRERIGSAHPHGGASCGQCSLACCLARMKDLPKRTEITETILQEAVRRAGGNLSLAARMLGISPQAMHANLRRHSGL